MYRWNERSDVRDLVHTLSSLFHPRLLAKVPGRTHLRCTPIMQFNHHNSFQVAVE